MKKGRLAYIDGRFIAIESAAAQAKRRKAEAAARAAAEGRVSKPVRKAPIASGLYYLLAAIEFVEAS